MERKLTLEDIRKIANSETRPIKPMPVKIPESIIKKYDGIYLSQERTKKILQMD
jgi:hypothetical protein